MKRLLINKTILEYFEEFIATSKMSERSFSVLQLLLVVVE